MSEYTLRYWRAENTEDSHYKFYEGYFIPGDLIERLNLFGNVTTRSALAVICYGRIGTSGQMQIFEFDDDTSAYSKARGAVWGKVANRDYHMVYDDYLIPITSLTMNDTGHAIRHRRGDTLRNVVTSAIKQEKFVSHQDAMSYIEGFTQECQQFLMHAKDATMTEEAIKEKFLSLTEKWEDFKGKYESAEAVFTLVSMRAMQVQAK